MPGWTAAHGRRASGLGYFGGPTGGIAFGIRNFWQSHPAQLDIRAAQSDAATVTLWVWAPDAPPMDLRFYHDGLGQDTYEKQYKGGLEITYEDYEPGFGTPHGRGAHQRDDVVGAAGNAGTCAAGGARARRCATRPSIVPTPQTIVESGVFGHALSLPSQTPPQHAATREATRLDVRFLSRPAGPARLVRLLELRRRHAHLRLRSPRVALRRRRLSPGTTPNWPPTCGCGCISCASGRADVFRFAEAMTRHTGEVDVHHLGRFAPLGSRHNVHALGMQRQTTAHQHGAESPLLLLPHRRRTRRRSDARAARSGAHAAHDSARPQAGRCRRHGRPTIRKATSRTWASAPTGVRWPAPGSPSGNARAIRRCAIDCSPA